MSFTGSISRNSWTSRISFLSGMMLISLVLLSALDMSLSFSVDTSYIKVSSDVASNASQCSTSSQAVDISWHQPAQTEINSLGSVINGTGIYGFIFDSSTTPDSVPYSTYNWCNMPRVRAQEYKIPNPDYQLQYVEVIHRHHKRTPYASNAFPIEQHSWSCSNSHLYYYASSDSNPSNNPAQITWQITPPTLPNIIYQIPSTTIGFPNSTCQFPQITSEGLQDSHQHGLDLRSVYLDLLHFLPETYDPDLVKFRVTNNVITSQVAGQVIAALYPSSPSQSNTTIPVTVQPATLDSLEPTYPCPASTALYSSYGVSSTNPAWLAHLQDPSTVSLFATLDAISGVNSSDTAWHDWVDHYFDNLSSKLCHAKPLGCNISNPSLCISRDMADDIFRRGLYEYSYIYRDDPYSLRAASGSYGVWIAELARHIRGAIDANSTTDTHTEKEEGSGIGGKNVIYRHNIAHDGSISRLLSILQVDVMVWPGMGSEVVFELYRRTSTGCWYVRILWKGEVLRSSSPVLMSGQTDEEGMIEVGRFLGYVDGLVGRGGVDVPGLCTVGG